MLDSPKNPIKSNLNQTQSNTQRQRAITTMLHADSLSSDPSDYQSMPTYQSNFRDNFEGDLNGRKSSKKRTSRPRKQPTLPNGVTSLQQQQQLKQQLLQKVLIKQNLKQYSLTSSDENLMNDDFESN